MARREEGEGTGEAQASEAPLEDAPSGKAIRTEEDEKLPEDQDAMQPDSE